jgi:hypothetical protein
MAKRSKGEGGRVFCDYSTESSVKKSVTMGKGSKNAQNCVVSFMADSFFTNCWLKEIGNLGV